MKELSPSLPISLEPVSPTKLCAVWTPGELITELEMATGRGRCGASLDDTRDGSAWEKR